MLASRACCRGIAAALVLATGLWHVIYLAQPSAIDLAPDETHYWLWSRHLDFSYYSKGPLVAWLIRLSCEIAGPVAESLTGSETLAIRLPAVWCGSATLVGLYILTLRSLGSERLALLVVAAALTLPMIALSRSLMTIDAPFVCCWCWALVLGHEAMIRRSRWAWPALGVVVGLGILAKYTMLLWLASAGLFLLFSREHRPLLWQRSFWTMVGIAISACIPIIAWNASNDWVSFRHVGDQAGVVSRLNRPSIRWFGPAVYFGAQFAILLGVWFIFWCAAMRRHRPGLEREPAKLFLWWMSLPTFVFFGAVSLRTDVLLNWPVAAYLSGMVLTAQWIDEGLRSGVKWKRIWINFSVMAASAMGVMLISGIFHVELVRPALIALAGPPTEKQPMPLRRFDPTCRLRGWRYLGREVAALREELISRGESPLIAASRWHYASEIAFYAGMHASVYTFGTVVSDRQSQFELWRPNPVRDPAHFVGRTFIFVDVRWPQEEIVAAFDEVEPTREVLYAEDGQPIVRFYLTVCRGFRGFAEAPRQKY